MRNLLLFFNLLSIAFLNAQTEEDNYLQAYKKVYFSKSYDELDSLKIVMFKYSDSQNEIISKSVPEILKEINNKQKSIDFDRYLKKEGADRKERILKKYGNKIGDRLVKRDIKIGMSYEMVSDSLGDPDDIHIIQTAHTYNSQWIYKSSLGDKYYYFENGRLVAIQD